MTTFVLVHGAWHGGWCWKRVQPLLRAAGHEVYAPTLTGLGERSHLLTPQVTLDTHIQDVSNVLFYEDLWDVVLVGHSYAGMVITGVAEKIPERLKCLVYLDAIVPKSGESIQQMKLTEGVAQEATLVDAEGDDWRVPPHSPEQYGVTDGRDARWMAKRLTAQPHATFSGSVQFMRHVAASLPKVYIRCTQSHGLFEPFVPQARAKAAWQVYDLDAGHDPMITAPHALAEVLKQAGQISRHFTGDNHDPHIENQAGIRNA